MQAGTGRKGASSKTKETPRSKPAAPSRIASLVRRALASLRAAPAAQSPLRLEPLEPRVLLSADPMGARVDGAIDVAGDTDHYTFTLANDLRVVFDSLTNNDNVHWNLSGPRGTVVADRGFASSDSVDVSGPIAMDLVAGDYRLDVDGVGDATGAYSFRLLDLAKATPLTLGSTVNAQLSPANETDAYKFSALAGQSVYFDSLVGGVDAWWRIVDPYGQPVAGPTSLGTDTGPIALAQDGVYTLLVEGRAGATGTPAYGFALHSVVDTQRSIVPGGADGMDPAWTTGQLGGALQLNGQQTLQVQPAASLDLTSSVTMEAWVKVDRYDATWTPIFYKGNGVAGQRSYSMWLNASGAVYLSTGDGGEETLTTAAGMVGAGAWHHVAGVIDRATGTMRIVVDGVQRAAGSVRAGAATSNPGTPLTIGGEPYETFTDQGRLAATIDDVRLWSVARSTADIAAARNGALAGNEAGLALYLRLDDAAGTAPQNASGTAQSVALVPVTSGIVAGRIPMPGGRVIYQVAIAADTRLYVDSLADDTNLRWSLAGPRGTVASARSFRSTDSVDGDSIFDLVAGTYTFVVDSVNDTTPAFAFRLLDLGAATAIAAGTPVAGALRPTRETDAYRFDASAGTRVYLDSTTTSSDAYWRVLDPYGRVLAGGNSLGTDIEVTTLPYTGTYTVLVEGRYYAGGSTGYGFTVHTVTDGTQALAVGSTVNAAIGVPGQRQLYTFTLAADSTLLFDSLTNSSAYAWSLAGPRGTEVSSRSFASSDSAQIGGTTALRLAAGAYTLTVDGVGDAVGSAGFRLLDLGQAAATALGATVSGTLDPGSTTAAYRFDASAGDQILLDRLSLAGGSPYWRLLDPTGVQLFGPEFFNDRAVTLPTTGRYTLLLEGQVNNLAATAYSFGVVFQGNVPPAALTGTAMTIGATVSGSIGAVGEADDYVFTIAAPTRVVFDGLTTNSQFNWRLDGPRGLELQRAIYADSTDQSATPAIDLVLAGTYRVRVTGSGSTTGNYAFRLLDLAAATPLTVGSVVAGTLSPADSTNAYKFTAQAGDRYFFDRTASAGGDTYWRLLDPYGRPVWGPTGIGNDVDVVTLAYAGTYTLLVEGRYSATGSATYSVAVRPVGDAAAALALGTPVAAAIASPGERDLYTFTLAGAKRVVFDGRGASNATTWSLRGPRGDVVTSRRFYDSDSVDRDPVLDLPAGDYTLTIDADGDATGAYGFALLDLAAATPIGVGTAISGTLNPATATAAYRFDAVAGERYFLDRSANSGGNTYWRLIDPYGSTVAGPTGFGNDIEAATLAYTGTYTVLVEGRYDAAATASYAYTLRRVVDDSTTLALDALVSGSIASAGQRDAYTFSLTAPRRVVVDGQVNNNALTWTLTGPRGDVATNRRFYATDASDGSSVFLLPAGDYLFRVDADGDATGAYAFRVLDAANATPIALGATVSGTLSPASATALYRFDAVAGERYFFDNVSNNGGDTTWRLIDPHGASVWGPQAIGSDVDVTTLATTGTYTLLVEGRYSATDAASYALRMHKVADVARTIVPGFADGMAPDWTTGQIGGALRLNGEQSLQAQPAASLDLRSAVTLEAWVRVDQYNDTWTPLVYKGTAANQRAYALLLNANGSVYLGSADASGEQGIQTDAGLVAAGEWHHVAGVIDRASGSLRILVDGVERKSGSVRTGQALTTAATPLFVGDSSETNSAYARLSGAIDDVRVWSTARTNAQIAASRNAALSGAESGLALYLKLDDAGGAAPLDSSAAAQSLALVPSDDAVVSGRIATPGQRVVYTVNVAADSRLYLDSLVDSASLRWSLSGARGVVTSNRSFQSSDSADGTSIYDLAAGAYTLVVDGVGDAVAHYAFRLLDLAQATPYVPGTTVSDMLTPASETRTYAFDVAAGDRYFADVSIDSGGDTYWRLLDPYGRAVFGPSSFADLDVMTLAYAGRYTLLVEGRRNVVGSAAYAFNLQKVADATRSISPGVADGYPADWTAGQLGGGLSLNPQQYLEVQPSAALDLGKTVTMEAWVKVDRFDDTWTPVIYKGAGTAGQRTYSLWLNANGAVHLSTGDGSDQNLTTAAGLIGVGEWHHVAGVIDRNAGTLRIVVDGVERASMSTLRTTTSAGGAGAPLLIGETTETDNAYARLFGVVDDVRVWNVARSSADIAADRGHALAGSPAGLVLYLKLDETSGTAAADASAQANAAQVVATTSGVVAGRIAHPGQRVIYQVDLAADARLYFDSLTNDSRLTWSLTGPRGTVTSGRSFQTSDGADGSAILDLVAGSYTLTVDGNGDATPAFEFRLLDLANAQPLTPGTAVSGELTPGRETDAYRFTATAGARYYFDDTLAAGGDTYWRLLDPYGRTLLGPAQLGNDFDVATLPYAGTYTLLVEGRYNAGNRSRYAIDVQPVADGSHALAVGAQTNGSIATAGQRQLYGFSLAADSRLLFDSLTNSGQFNWTLAGPLGTVVSSRNFNTSDSGNLSGATLLALAAGSYTLTVDGAGDATGDFSFRLLDLADATSIALGADVTGTLSPGNATALYKFGASAGDQVFFDRKALSGGSPYWRLIDPTGVQLFGPESFNDRAPITLAMTGTYTVAFEGLVGDTAATGYTFNLTLQGNTPPAALTGTSIALGGTVSSVISAVGEADDYVFTIAAPTRVVFDGLTTSASFNWRLDGPRGLEVSRAISADSWDGGATSAIELALAGTYRVRVTGSSGATGNYAFRLLDLASATAITPGTATTPGTVVSGTLNPADSTQLYRFDALAGERYYFDRTANSGGDTYWRLLDPYGRPVWGPTGIGTDVDVVTLPYAGRYTLLVEGRYYVSGSATYAFDVQRVGDDTAALVLNTPTTGTIAQAGQRDIYTVTLATAKRVVVDTRTNSDFRWSLTGPRGSVASDRSFQSTDSFDGSSIYDLVAGDYTLTVDGVGDDVGSYAFSVVDLGTATAITANQAVTGTLNPASATQAYRFDAVAGDRYYFDRTASAGGSTYWRLIDPYGRGVWGPASIGNDVDVTTLTQTGAYTLLVEGRYNAAGSATYAFNVQKVVDDAAAMALDANVSGTIAQAGQRDVYTFTLGETKRVVFDSLTDSDKFRWSLTGPRGSVTSDRDFQASDSIDGSSIYELVAGTYTVVVDALNDAVGGYLFRVLDLAHATPITPGIAVSGTLNPAASTQLYRFDAQAGDRYFFDRTANASGTYWRLLDPYGATVFGPATLGTDIDSTTLAVAGTYTLLVEGRVSATGTAGYAFNVQPSPVSAAVPIVGLSGTTAEPGPDLRIENLAITPAGGTLRSGGTVTVRWEVVNAGDQAAAAPWQDRLLVRNLDRAGQLIQNLLVDYVDLGTDAATPLQPGQRRVREVSVVLPAGNAGAGNLRFEVSTDVTNVVAEAGGSGAGESNNQATLGAVSQLVAYPDLQVVGLTVDPAAAWNAGDGVTVRWTVRNAGSAPVDVPFVDSVLVRNLLTGQTLTAQTVAHAPATDGALGAGADRNRQATFTWPAGLAGSGTFEFIVTTDAGFAVFENNGADSAETNNGARITATSAADLVVQNLQASPAAIGAGDTVTVQWTDRNAGAARTPAGWTDRVLVKNLATGEVLLDRAVAYDPALPGNAALAANGSVARSTSFTLPAGQRGAGQIQVQVFADANTSGQGTLPEYDATGAAAEANNGATIVFTSAQRSYADLQVTQFTVPAAGHGGDVVSLSWTVTNAGGDVTAGAWTDRIVLSIDDVYGNADDRVLADVAHTGVLQPTASYTATRDVTLPLFVEGSVHVFVRADATGQVLEPDTRDDNTSTPAVLALTTPAADLAVEVVTAPATADSGQLIDVLWRVRNQGDYAASGGWRDAVYLSADGTLDTGDILLGSFQRSGALAAGETYTTRGRVALPFELTGTYRILVVADADDAVFEHGAPGNNVGAAVSATVIAAAPAPDLETSAVTVPATALAGGTATVNWTLTNRGEAAVVAPWVDKVYLSANGAVAGATLLGTLTHGTGLAIGAAQTYSLQVTLPTLADGDYQVLVVSDANGQVYEATREANNTAASAAPVALQHRDLVVTALSAPARAVSGSVVTVERQVGNAGSAAVAGNWVDRYYLSRNTTLDSGDRLLAEVAAGGPLAPGASYGGPIDLTIPIDAGGAWYVLAVTDATNTIGEVNAENNNVGAVAIDVALAPYADLAVSNVSAPTQVIQDPARISVGWTVTNNGTGVGRTLQWTDTVVVSTDAIAGNGDDIVIASFEHAGALAVGASYSRTETIFAPPALTGHYNVFVRTDASDVVFENGSEANNAAKAPAPLDVMPIPYADLHVTSLAVPATGRSGAPLAVTWTVRNDGIGPTDRNGWSDVLQLASDAAGTQIITSVGADHFGVLAVGGSYVRTASITVPNGYSGPLYVVVRTGGPFEFTHDKDDVAVSGPVQIALAPAPDLRVTDIVAPAAADEGDTVEITWTVSNDGQAAAAGTWRDQVSLRKPGSASVQPIVLGSFEYTAGLGAGLTYTRTERFRLPTKIEGAWQVSVTTDTGNAVYEGSAESNNTTGDDQPIVLSLNPRPDLQVQTITAPDHVTAGATAAVSFVIVNRGPVATSTPHWRDNIYLSLDDKASADDILLGSLENGSALAKDEAYTSSTTSIVIPERFRGAGFIVVVADASGSVDEYPAANEANNVVAKAIVVDPQPLADLVTSGVVAPAQAVYGGEIEVRYTVTNKGSATTNRSAWTDTVWLTTDKTRPSPSGNQGIQLGSFAHVGALAVGASYEQVVKVRIPQQIASGTYYVTAWSDAYDAVFEDTLAVNVNPDDPNEFDNNNYKARAVDVIGTPIPPLPDLQVTNVVTSAPGSVDAPFTVTWTVANLGEGAAAGTWYDTILVHDLPDYRTSGAQVWNLGTFERGAELASLAAYTLTKTIDLSPAVRGHYVTVIADALPPPAPHVDESIETNNVRTVAAEIAARPADLKVTSVSAPAQNFSGEHTTITWTVRNDGAAVWGGTRIWTDTVWISPDPTFIANRARLIGSTVHSNVGGLAAGASYTASADVVLPAGIGGDYFVYVVADDHPTNGSPFLTAEARSGNNERSRGEYGASAYEDAAQVNNMTRGDVAVTYREPDLKVAQLVLPPGELRSGQTISVGFTVLNQGTRQTREDFWYDRLYLSRDPSLDSHDLQVAEFARYGQLAAGASYDRTATFTLPGDADGPFYLIAFTDADISGVKGTGSPAPVEVGEVRLLDDRVPEFRDEGNNTTVVPITVTLSPAADLRVTRVSAPQRVEAGQVLHVGYTVTNVGGAITSAATWNDHVYLSADAFFDPVADRYLGVAVHKDEALAAGAGYDGSFDVRLPRDVVGPYYVFIRTDAPGSAAEPRGKVFEALAENNNVTASAQPVLIELPPPADLEVTDIDLPPAATSGVEVRIGFTVANTSAVNAVGSWTDTLYLSADGTWDLGDVRLGTVSHTGGLLAGHSYDSELKATLPPAKAGQYRIIVRSDIYNEVYEGTQEADNATASADVIAVTVPELQLGVAQALTLSPGEQRLFRVTVGTNETLRFTLASTDPASANEIYVRYGDVASGFAFDAGAIDPLSPSPVALIPSTKAGDYYVLIQGRSGSKVNVPMTLTATVLPFSITDISQDQGGDGRWVTTTITGARFQPGAIVKLVRPGIAEITPTRYQVVDATTIVATWDLRGEPHGLYDVAVINPDGAQAVLPYRYLIESALEIDVTIGLGGPRVVPAGQSGLYGISLQSLTNVDTPYVHFEFGAPEMGDNAKVYGLPFVTFNSNVRGAPDGERTDVAWASLDSEVNDHGWMLAPGYAFDVTAGGYVGMSFSVATYPGLKALADRDFEGFKRAIYDARPDLAKADRFAGGVASLTGAYAGLKAIFDNPLLEVPDEAAQFFMPFRFNVTAAATPMTRAEFVAEQTDDAKLLRAAILADHTANAALVNLAADEATWVAAYLAALEDGGLLRPEDEAPPIRRDPKVVSLLGVLASGVLVGPAGSTIQSPASLVSFFAKVHAWYGDTPGLKAKVSGYDHRVSEEWGEYDIPIPALPTLASFDLGLSHPTYFQAFNVFSPWLGFDPNVALPDFASVAADSTVTPLALQALFEQAVQAQGAASISGPQGYGSEQYVPAGTALPYTIRFRNPAESTLGANEVRIVADLDPALSARSFRLGDMKIGGVNITLPKDRAAFQGDFDLRNSLGFIVRVSAGIDTTTATASWVLQAIDPQTGEVLQDATRSLLPPDNAQGRGSGFVSYTVTSAFGAQSGTQIDASARVLLNNQAPVETNTVTHRLDASAPVTTVSARQIVAGGGDYDVRWQAQEEAGGSGLRHTTVYVRVDGGDWAIWQRQTTATSAVWSGPAGHHVEFMALSTDNAGNRERPPEAGVPDDGSTTNLGTTPSVGSTTVDVGQPPAPSNAASTNPLFVQAQANLSAAVPTHPSLFTTVVAPFTGEVFGTGVGQSYAGIGPLALLERPDGSFVVSGGGNRGALYVFDQDGGKTLAPAAQLDSPVFDMAWDGNGGLWATSGGGQLLELAPASLEIVNRYGDGLTQSLAYDAAKGVFFVSSGSGIERFDPVTRRFSHFSDVRVDDLAVAPDGTLWASSWPVRGDIVKFDNRGRAQVQVRLDAALDSIAFGRAGTQLQGLLFVSSRIPSGSSAAADLYMIDLKTLRVLKVAKGGPSAEQLLATSDGRLLVANGTQVDVIAPLVAPSIVRTTPADGSLVALPEVPITVTFDKDMVTGDASRADSVLNPVKP